MIAGLVHKGTKDPSAFLESEDILDYILKIGCFKILTVELNSDSDTLPKKAIISKTLFNKNFF